MEDIFEKLKILAKEFVDTDCKNECKNCKFKDELYREQYDTGIDLCTILQDVHVKYNKS